MLRLGNHPRSNPGFPLATGRSVGYYHVNCLVQPWRMDGDSGELVLEFLGYEYGRRVWCGGKSELRDLKSQVLPNPTRQKCWHGGFCFFEERRSTVTA
jgi:hypothetical protein